MIRAKVEWPPGSKVLPLGLLVAALMALSLMLTAKAAHADTFTVTNTNDGGEGSLRQAIADANARKGQDTIKFNIPGSVGVKTIFPTSAMPVITDPLTIDGYSQLGSRPNSQATGGTDALIFVELSGIIDTDNSPGLQIDAPNVVVRGLAINRFEQEGILIEGERAVGARIEGNFIGTDRNGTLDLGNVRGGVKTFGDRGKHAVGGVTPDKRNILSGNNGEGIDLDGAEGNKVQGNLIGVQKDGTSPLGNSGQGVHISSSNNTLGGATSGAANTIAFNALDGVNIAGDGNTGNRILDNSIFSNGDLGIDIGSGRTLNDPKDPDVGPNNFQNFPVLTSVKLPEEGKITIEGALDSTPSTKKKKKRFTIQFFSNPQGEDDGKTFLGQTRVTTNKQGKASFSFETTKPLNTGDRITATATDSKGNTSEFSEPLVLVT